MGIGLGAVKGMLLGILYTLVATPPFALVYFGKGRWVWELFPLVAACAVPAGALVGAAVVFTRSYRRGEVWRAQLAMLLIYALTGIAFVSMGGKVRILHGLELAVGFAPVFVPLGLLATWAAVRWIRGNPGEHRGSGVTPSRVHP